MSAHAFSQCLREVFPGEGTDADAARFVLAEIGLLIRNALTKK